MIPISNELSAKLDDALISNLGRKQFYELKLKISQTLGVQIWDKHDFILENHLKRKLYNHDANTK